MKTLKFFYAPLMGLILLGASCIKQKEGEQGTTRVAVRLTDAPGNYDAVNVDIQTLEYSADGQKWMSLNVKRGIYNLLDFRNGIDTLLVNQTLPSGHISHMRLGLGTENSVVVGGVKKPLNTPSAQQSGLKFNVDATLLPAKDSGAYTIWIDFDAGNSVVARGDGNYNLKPVIRAFTQETSGKIKGIVLPTAAKAAIEVIKGTDTVRTSTNVDGSFVVGGLADGAYSVHINPTIGVGVSDSTINNVDVKFGTIVDLNTITLK